MVDPSPRSRWLFRFALATALAMSALILVGGTVTSRDAGMAFADAPLSDGALINPAGWLQDTRKFIEHSHRLVGWVVGMLATATVLVGFVVERRRWVRMFSIWVLFAITAQGIMGIFRVREVSTALAMVHGVWGQICLASVGVLVLVTSGRWRYGLPVSRCPRSHQGRQAACVVPAMVLVQVALGAYTRHMGTGLGLILHVWWAIMTAVVIGRWAMWVLGEVTDVPLMRRGAMLLGGLTGLQLMLGLGSFVVTGGSSARVIAPAVVQWAVPTLHVITGALIFATSCALAALAYRTSEPLCGESPRDESLRDESLCDESPRDESSKPACAEVHTA